eukprot:s232_g5.t1
MSFLKPLVAEPVLNLVKIVLYLDCLFVNSLFLNGPVKCWRVRHFLHFLLKFLLVNCLYVGWMGVGWTNRWGLKVLGVLILLVNRLLVYGLLLVNNPPRCYLLSRVILKQTFLHFLPFLLKFLLVNYLYVVWMGVGWTNRRGLNVLGVLILLVNRFLVYGLLLVNSPPMCYLLSRGGVKEEEFQTCLRGVLSELRMKPKNLSEEFGRFQTAFIKRSYDFDRRDKQIALLESGAVDLKEVQRFVREEVRAAPALYVQVRKVLDKPDKPLPEGSVIPEDPADLQVWRGYEEGVKQRELLKTWVPMNAEIEVMDASGGYL